MIVTGYGDKILPYRSVLGCTESYEPKMDDELKSVSIHNTCNGFVDLMQTSEEFQTFVCRSCGLRVVIPISCRTYGDVVGWLPITKVKGMM